MVGFWWLRLRLGVAIGWFPGFFVSVGVGIIQFCVARCGFGLPCGLVVDCASVLGFLTITGVSWFSVSGLLCFRV